jgi:hypothetical protein
MDRMPTIKVKTECNELKAPFLACQLSKWFMTLPPELLQEQHVEVHCWRD